MNARPKITHAEAALIPWPELAKMETAAMWRNQRCQVSDHGNMPDKSPEAIAARARIRKTVIQTRAAEMQRRILRALKHGPKTVTEIADTIGEGRSKVGDHVNAMRKDGLLDKRYMDRNFYWGLIDKGPVNAHHCEAITIRGVTYESSRIAAAALGVSHQAIADAKRRGKLDGVGLRKATGRYQHPAATLTFGAQK